MALKLYDAEDNDITSNPIIRTQHNGQLGSAEQVLVYLMNDDATDYYTDLEAWIEGTPGEDSHGEASQSGFTFKVLCSSLSPTEVDFGRVLSGSHASMGDIGSTSAGDIETRKYIHIRIYVPGNTPAQWRDYYKLKIRGIVHKVGT